MTDEPTSSEDKTAAERDPTEVTTPPAANDATDATAPDLTATITPRATDDLTDGMLTTDTDAPVVGGGRTPDKGTWTALLVVVVFALLISNVLLWISLGSTKSDLDGARQQI